MSTIASKRKYLRLLDAADYLGQTERFMRLLVQQRRIRFYKIGKYLCFTPTDLDAFAQAGCVNPITTTPAVWHG